MERQSWFNFLDFLGFLSASKAFRVPLVTAFYHFYHKIDLLCTVLSFLITLVVINTLLTVMEMNATYLSKMGILFTNVIAFMFSDATGDVSRLGMLSACTSTNSSTKYIVHR